jgi:hypothetical protein
MARRQPSADNPPVPPSIRTISADAIFSLAELRTILALPRHTLAREARLGRLRTSRRASRLWTTGAWVHEWVRDGEVRRGRDAAPEYATEEQNGSEK